MSILRLFQQRQFFLLIVIVGCLGAAFAVYAKAAKIANPFVYCKVTGTVDQVAWQNIHRKAAASLLHRIGQQFHFSKETPLFIIEKQTLLRCEKGQLKACVVGANLPCGKANTNKTPSLAMQTYCHDHSDEDFIPAYLTGHDTAYEWRCVKGKAIISKAFKLDSQGYLSAYWQIINR